MAIPCAMSLDGRLFLVHCELNEELGYLDAAIVIAEPLCSSGWTGVVVPDIYGGERFQVRVPIHLAGNDSRHKGYNVRLPILRPELRPSHP